MDPPNPYDEMPYRSYPVEWSAPERLALASLLHGGPRAPNTGYRVLELGSGDGANLLPMAFYRPHASFIGVDAASTRVALAERRATELGLRNVEFVAVDFRKALSSVRGRFDYILAHGVFSWVDDETRDALVELCAELLAPNGLLYVNYNARPGWDIRALVRRHLLEATDHATGLEARTEQAQLVATRVLTALTESPHPYRQLIINEYRIVCEADPTYVAHEYLAPYNHCYWRSEFLAMMRGAGFDTIADADFNYPSGRMDPDLPQRLQTAEVAGASSEDTIDLLSYRQLHSPILVKTHSSRRPIDAGEMGRLAMASCLAPQPPVGTGPPSFVHTSGYEVEARHPAMEAALRALYALWPGAQRIDQLFPDVRGVFEDLVLLYRNGLIDLRMGSTPDEATFNARLLNQLERRWGGYRTYARHVCERCDVGD